MVEQNQANSIKPVSVGRMTVPLVMVGGVVFGVLWLGSQIIGERDRIDKSIGDLTKIVQTLAKNVELISKNVEQKTAKRWTSDSMALWCANTALGNPGFRCPNPNAPSNAFFVAEGSQWRTRVEIEKK